MRTLTLICTLLCIAPISGQHVRVHYLAIANEHYADKAAYSDLPSASNSVEEFVRLLSPFGEGSVLKSHQSNPLTKRTILSAVDTLVSEYSKDSTAIVLIYYCGHGEMDRYGNVYMIPGAVQHAPTLSRRNAFEQLLPLPMVQEIFVNRINGAVGSSNSQDVTVALVEIMLNELMRQGAAREEDFGVGVVDTAAMNAESLSARELLIDRLPRMLLLMDICQSRMDVPDSAYEAYDGPFFADQLDTTSALYNKETDRYENNAMVTQWDSLHGKGDLGQLTLEVTRNMYLALGSSVILSSLPGEASFSVPLKRPNGSIIAVGPVLNGLAKAFDHLSSSTEEELHWNEFLNDLLGVRAKRKSKKLYRQCFTYEGGIAAGMNDDLLSKWSTVTKRIK